MGANDAAEMLAAAQAECVRLERELARLQLDVDMHHAFRPQIECAVAVHLDEECDWEPIAKWCGGTIDSGPDGTDSGEWTSAMIIPGVRDHAVNGTWIVLNQDGTFSVVYELREPTRALSPAERTRADRFGMDTATPPVSTVRVGRQAVLAGEVYMASVLNGREGMQEALLENGEYLVGLHVRPNALPEDVQP